MKIHRLLILFPLICRCRELLNRTMFSGRLSKCFWLVPLFTRLRQRLKLLRFRCFRISFITCCSARPNWYSTASKGVLSSQAISMIRSMSLSVKTSLKQFCVFLGICFQFVAISQSKAVFVTIP
jgi:hypothetical protein